MSGKQQTVFGIDRITSIGNGIERLKEYYKTLHGLERIIREDPFMAHKMIAITLDDGKSYHIEVGMLHMNMILWMYNVTYGEKITSDDLQDFSEINKGVFLSAMDKIIHKFVTLGHDLDRYRVTGMVKEEITKIGRFYSRILSNTFSIFDIMLLESRNPQFAELINSTVDTETMSISEIEEYLRKAKTRLYELIIQDKQSTIYPYVSSGIVKAVQMGQMFVGVGPRNDIDKSIMPVVVKRSWLHGLSSNAEFFVEAVSTRNTIIVKKDNVPDSGYLSRKVNLACLSTNIDHDIIDCGTKHYLNFFVKDAKYLDSIDGKYMVMNDEGNLVKEVTKDDNHLIGQTIKLRSHTKCITGHDSNRVCCVCYGSKHQYLADTNIGGLVSIKFINSLTQLGLSAKHASETNSEEIGGALIFKYFQTVKSRIYLNKDYKKHVGDLKILLPLEIVTDIIASYADGEDDTGLNFSKSIDTLMVLDGSDLQMMNFEDKSYSLDLSSYMTKLIGKSNDVDIVSASDVYNIIGHPETEEEEDALMYDEFVTVNFRELDFNEPLFNVKIITEEVSKYLKIIKNIIDGVRTQTYKSVEDIIADIFEIVFLANIGSKGMIIHIETLVLNLMRDIEDNLKHPDFTELTEPNVQFLKLKSAIQHSDLFTGIVFQDLRRQLESPVTLRKNSRGIFDTFFHNEKFHENSVEYAKTRKWLDIK